MALLAAVAFKVPVFTVPPTVPGGNPVTEVPGNRSRSPLNVVGPVLVTVVPATTDAVEAAPRLGLVADQAGVVLNATIKAPATSAVRPPLMAQLEFLLARCFMIILPFRIVLR
jgi:hypothetical protein